MPKIFHAVINLPGLAKREAILHYQEIELEKGKKLYITKNSQFKGKEKFFENSIKMNVYKATLVIETSEGLQCTEFCQCDLGGWIPKSIQNLFIQHNVINNL